MRIQARSVQMAIMTLVYRANPNIDWSITMRQGVAMIGYPRGGDALLPLHHAVGSGREFLIAMDEIGRSWLECQRPAQRTP